MSQEQTLQPSVDYKESYKSIENVDTVLKESSEVLAKVGGFKLVESLFRGSNNLNPANKARKKIFLTDKSKEKEREELKKSLLLYLDVLESNDDVVDMISTSQKKADKASVTLKKNLRLATEESKELESSYRSVALFFKNAEVDKINNLTVVNAPIDKLRDLDDPEFIDAIGEEINANFDRLDLRYNYSLLVVPGWLGSNLVVDKLAKIAHKNKVMMVTDYDNVETPEETVQYFEGDNLTSGDTYKSNVMMTCNWLIGRGKDTSIGEEEDTYVPPSTALAGKIYGTLMSQVAAGKKFGTLNEIGAVRYPLKKSELTSLEKMGLVPMVNEYGKVMAFSAKTLFNGDNLGLQTYSVVRVFDYVMKVLMDFLNKRAFENFTVDSKKELQREIEKFLDKITGPNNLIEKFKILKFEQDKKQKDRVFLDIHMTPYFPAKNFIISLDGQKGTDTDSADWNAEYAQQ